MNSQENEKELRLQAPQAQLPTMPTRWDERSRMVRQAGHFLQRQVKTKLRQKSHKTARAAAVHRRLEELEAAFSWERVVEQTTALHKTSKPFLEFVQVTLIRTNKKNFKSQIHIW